MPEAGHALVVVGIEPLQEKDWQLGRAMAERAKNVPRSTATSTRPLIFDRCGSAARHTGI